MPVTDIKEIRLLPPLAIGRFGGSAEPMHNYDVEINSATDYRDLVPAETLLLDPGSGEVVAKQTPPVVRFKDGAGLVKPVCPFIEVWARYDETGDFLPLTLVELQDLGLSPAALSWDVTFANLKVLRRTGEPADRVTAALSGVTDHQRHSLEGRAVNFKSGQSIHFGFVQYVKPTATHPEIRFRFTPPAGLVYGTNPDSIVPANRAVYDPVRGTWDTHNDDNPEPASAPDPRAHISTSPGGIYANRQGRSLGYLDDASDGIVTVMLTLSGNRRLGSFSRLCAGPPAFAPDSFPVRTMGDELEQMAHGPDVSGVNAEEVLDIVRRAVETVRLTDTDLQNEVWGREFDAFPAPFSDTEAAPQTTSSIHTGLLDGLSKGLKAPANSPARSAAHFTLSQIDGILRDFDKAADHTRAGRRRMPALMRGADGMNLALNRRQRSKIAKAVEVFAPAPGPGPGTDPAEVAAMKRMITNFQAMAVLHAGFSEDGKSLADRFPDPPAVLDYLRKAVAKGSVATAAGLAGQPLVVPGDPDGSAFLAAIKRPGHPMNGPLSGYRDPTSGKSGLEVVAEWITSIGGGA
jgi:hypothetical protein